MLCCIKELTNSQIANTPVQSRRFVGIGRFLAAIAHAPYFEYWPLDMVETSD